MALPDGFVASAPQGRFIKFTVAEGDFIHGKILARKEQHNEKFNRDETLYTIEVIDCKLTNYDKRDGTPVDQSSIAAGDTILVTATAQLQRELGRYADGVEVYAEFQGKKPVKTKVGDVDMNSYIVGAPAKVEAPVTEAPGLKDKPF